jgi:TolB-like protein
MKVREKIRFITSSSPAASPAARLTSWKEIAVYLGRDARTVQLWEKQEGLPIHRHAHQLRAGVYAYPAELDAWLKARTSRKAFGFEIPASGSKEEVRPARLHWRRAAAAMLLLGLLGGGLWIAANRRATLKQPAGILAVLPFENLSASEDFLVDGLTEGLITDLGKTGQIQVISRRSVMQFKGQHLPLPQIAAKLHASLVLEGAVTRSGDEMRVTVQLLDAARDRSLWAASYHRKTTDFLAFQDEIAATIAAEVTQKLTGALPPASSDAKAVDPRAGSPI